MVLNCAKDKVVFENGVFVKKRMGFVNLTFDFRHIYGDGFFRSVDKIKEVWRNFENYL